jgi:hypothetical protein
MYIARFQRAARAALGTCLLSWTLLPGRAQANQGSERSEAPQVRINGKHDTERTGGASAVGREELSFHESAGLE